jgi:dipeptidyl aminopeptidase/acylaminoacyl peptidase
MVVFVHGGPYGIRDSWKFDPYVQAMATRGYAVLQVNYRGSGGYGYGFMKAGWMEWGGKMQDDVTDATRWAVAQGIADKDRICIYGGSYGGYAALEGAVKEPDLYRCAVGYVGVYDLKLMYADGDIPQSRYGKEYLKRVLGTGASVLAKGSPVDQLDALKAKVMLIVGGRDVRVPAAQGKNLHDALSHRGIQHEWLYKSDEAHGFYDEGNIAELFGKVDEFLAANIGPHAKGANSSATAKSP